MNVRRLEKKDASLMLEWMHDKNVTEKLSANFGAKTLEDAELFIENSLADKTNYHLAITNDNDEYMGTVSLKHITTQDAEFAITVRSCAMGKGYSWFGMKQILKIGFEGFNLERIYWCVDKTNERAVKYYNKHGFMPADEIGAEILARYKGMDSLVWYAVNDFSKVE